MKRLDEYTISRLKRFRDKLELISFYKERVGEKDFEVQAVLDQLEADILKSVCDDILVGYCD